MWRSAWIAAAFLAAVPTSKARASDLLPTPLPEDDYAETFTFVADLDDGTYVQLQLAVTNLGPGSGTGLCRALVKRPSEPAWTGHRRVPSREWSHREEAGAEVLVVGPCAVHSSAVTQVRTEIDGRAVALSFARPLVTHEVPGSPIRIRDREYRSWILQPFATASVRLEGFASGALLSGGGYADHSRTNLSPGDLARRWVRFRALRPEASLLLLARERPDGRWEPAWLWPGGEHPRALDAVELHLLKAEPGGGRRWTVAVREGPVRTELAVGPLLHRHAPLAELGVLGALVAPFVRAPITYTYRATLAAPAPVDGVLEISVFED